MVLTEVLDLISTEQMTELSAFRGTDRIGVPCLYLVYGGATPLWCDRLAIWPIRLQTQFCMDVRSEHTPINLPSRKSSFQVENDAAIAASEDCDLLQHLGASTVPTLLKLGSLGSRTRKLVADYDSVARSFTSTRKLAADADHKTIVPSVEVLCTGEKEIEI